MDAFEQRYGGPGQGTALQLVQMITETFPAFRDAAEFEGRTGETLTPVLILLGL